MEVDEFTRELISHVVKEVNKATTVAHWLSVFAALSSIQSMVWVEIWKNADPDMVARTMRPNVLKIITHLHMTVASASPEILQEFVVDAGLTDEG